LEYLNTVIVKEVFVSYTLYYFPIRGRGEQVRLFFRAFDIAFEDVHTKRDAFLELKKEGPAALTFGSLPMLQDGSFRLCQSPVILSYLASKHDAAPSDPQQSAMADAIAWGAEDLRMQYFKLFGDEAETKQAEFVAGSWQQRWLPNLDGLLELNGAPGHFVGDSLSHADIAVWDVLDAILINIDAAELDGFSHLTAFYDTFRARPAVAAYIESGERLS
jgi:glutathione S-transferase